MRLFSISHLRDVEESYLAHLRFGLWAAVVLGILALVSLIHAVLPVLFPRIPDRIYRYFVTRSAERMSRVNSILKRKNLE